MPDSLSSYCYICKVLICAQDPFKFAIPFDPHKTPEKIEQPLVESCLLSFLTVLVI